MAFCVALLCTTVVYTISVKYLLNSEALAKEMKIVLSKAFFLKYSHIYNSIYTLTVYSHFSYII